MPSTKRKPRPKRKPAPEVQAAANPNWGRELVPWGQPAGVHVNEFTVLKVAAVVACVRYIATSIGQIDYNVYEHLPGEGKRYLPDHPVDWLLDKEANPETPAPVFWETVTAHAATWGNGYAEIQVDGFGRVQWLWQITPDRVTMKRADRDYPESGVGAGEQFYEVHNDDGSFVRVPARRMFHLRGLSWDGQLGYNVARLCRDVFGGAIAAQDFANAYFENDATPGGVLSTPNTLSEPAYQRMRAGWAQAHRGARNAHAIAILEEATAFQAISKDAQQSQLVETQQNAVEQVARVFGVPLTKIGHMIHSGNRANMEEDDRAAYKSCLRPWARKIECEADVKLFGRVNRGRLFTLHDFSVLLKGNSEQTTNQACQLADRGILSVNEARDLFDLNPLPAALGDTRPFPRNFTILEKAGEDPPAAGSGGAGGDSPGAGRSNKPPGSARAGAGPAQPAAAPAPRGALPAQVGATFGGLLADAYGRLLRVEADKAKRAGNKDGLGTHIVNYYNPDGARNVAAALRPVLEALLLALGRPPDAAEAFAGRFAEDHAARSVRELCDGTWLHAWANGRAAEQAAEHLNTLWESL